MKTKKIIIGLLMGFIPMQKVAAWGGTIIGLGFLFFGMEIMSGELKVLAKDPVFMQAFQTFKCAPVNGYLPFASLLGAIFVGLIATCVIQSSSACTGIIIALGASGLLDIYTAVALVLGSNIGTTITAQLAALASNRIAKQAALAHTLFNILGVIITIVCFWIVIDGQPVFFRIIKMLGGDLPRQIANAHTLFNVVTTLLLLPAIPLLAKICERIIPIRSSTKVKFEFLEPHLLDTPSIALAQTNAALRKMLKKSWKMVNCALNVYNRNDEKNQQIDKQLERREADVDERQKAISAYLAKLMTRQLSRHESEQIPLLLHCTNDAERIGDHAAIIRRIFTQMEESELSFSSGAEAEYDKMHDMLAELADTTIQMLKKPCIETQSEAVQMQRQLKNMLDISEKEHFTRISAGDCKPEVGILFLELLEEIRKITRHLENINDRAAAFYGKIPRA